MLSFYTGSLPLLNNMNRHSLHWLIGVATIGQDSGNNKWPKQGYQHVQVLRQGKIEWQCLFTISAKMILCMQQCWVNIQDLGQSLLKVEPQNCRSHNLNGTNSFLPVYDFHCDIEWLIFYCSEKYEMRVRYHSACL